MMAVPIRPSTDGLEWNMILSDISAKMIWVYVPKLPLDAVSRWRPIVRSNCVPKPHRLIPIINSTHEMLFGHTMGVLKISIPLKDTIQHHREKKVIEWRGEARFPIARMEQTVPGRAQ
jgi:hypothetical protein